MEMSQQQKKQKKTEEGPFGLTWETRDGTLLILNSSSIKGSKKIAAFDMDDTLITPKSGQKFPKNREDWKFKFDEVEEKLKKLNEDGYKIVIFSNQAGIEKKKQKASDIKGKIWDIAETLGFPIQAFVATATDRFRKPNTTMWDIMVNEFNEGVKPEETFYVGDAAGRAKGWKKGAKKDHSCSDRKFAYNCGIDFKTPEEYFLGEDPVDFSWGSPDPKEFLKKYEKEKPDFSNVHKKEQEMIIFVGEPASGKSSFAKKYLLPHGYVHVNQDTLKRKEKCIATAKEAVEEGKSVVIDNTNPQAKTRAEYIAIAKKKGIPVRCFHFTTEHDLAYHLNYYREKLVNTRRIPDVAYRTYKSRFEEPSLDEGFTEVKKIDFVLDFEKEEHKKLFLQRT